MPVYPPPPPIRLDQGGNDFLGSALGLVNMLESQREAEQLRMLREQQNQRAQAQEARAAAEFPLVQQERGQRIEANEVTLRKANRDEASDLASQDKIRGLAMDAVRELDEPARRLYETIRAQGGPKDAAEAKAFSDARKVLDQTDAFNPASPMYNPELIETAAMTGSVLGLPEAVARRVNERMMAVNPQAQAEYERAIQLTENAKLNGELLSKKIEGASLELAKLRGGVVGSPADLSAAMADVAESMGKLQTKLFDAQESRREIRRDLLMSGAVRDKAKEWASRYGEEPTEDSDAFWHGFSRQIPVLYAADEAMRVVTSEMARNGAQYELLSRQLIERTSDGRPKPGAAGAGMSDQQSSEFYGEFQKEMQKSNLKAEVAQWGPDRLMNEAMQKLKVEDRPGAREVFEAAGIQPTEEGMSSFIQSNPSVFPGGITGEKGSRLLAMATAMNADGPIYSWMLEPYYRGSTRDEMFEEPGFQRAGFMGDQTSFVDFVSDAKKAFESANETVIRKFIEVHRGAWDQFKNDLVRLGVLSPQEAAFYDGSR